MGAERRLLRAGESVRPVQQSARHEGLSQDGPSEEDAYITIEGEVLPKDVAEHDAETARIDMDEDKEEEEEEQEDVRISTRISTKGTN